MTAKTDVHSHERFLVMRLFLSLRVEMLSQ